MSKRGGSELNHDNWDEEEEKEEQGTFRKAPENEMKGRVIRKAKRRNANNEGEERKNVFAGFGGFAGAPKPAGEAFSFLSKPADTGSKDSSDSPKPSFVFGEKPSGNGVDTTADTAVTKPSFAFGSNALGKPTDNGSSDTTASKSNFVFGSGATTKAAGAFSFGSGPAAAPKATFSFGAPPSDDKKESTAPSFGNFTAFAPKNVQEKVEEKKEEVSSEVKVDNDLMAKFKPKGWNCSVCMISNDVSKEKCAACETPKPGSKPAETTSIDKPLSFVKEGGFTFGATSSQTPAAGSGFTFGEKKSEDKPPEGGGGFVFGKKKDTESEGEDGSRTTAKPAVENDKGCDTPNKEYLSHLKALNIQVTDWIKKHVDDNPLVLLSPVFKDYEKHLKVISDKYGGTSNKPSEVVETKSDDLPGVKPKESSSFSLSKSGGFSFGKTETSDKSSFSFGSTEAKKPEEPKSGFSFGASTDKPAATPAFSFGSSSDKPASTGGFSFGSSTTTGAEPAPFSFGSFSSSSAAAPVADKEEEEEEDKPPVVEVKQVTEEDAIYSKKCKLFYKKDGNYVEKGVGMLHLKPIDNGKTQLLIRADTNLGNVLLNILLSPQIPTTRVGKNNVMLVCVPNPPLETKKDDTSAAPISMLIRVKTSEDADELKNKVDELKKK